MVKKKKIKEYQNTFETYATVIKISIRTDLKIEKTYKIPGKRKTNLLLSIPLQYAGEFVDAVDDIYRRRCMDELLIQKQMTEQQQTASFQNVPRQTEKRMYNRVIETGEIKITIHLKSSLTIRSTYQKDGTNRTAVLNISYKELGEFIQSLNEMYQKKCDELASASGDSSSVETVCDE